MNVTIDATGAFTGGVSRVLVQIAIQLASREHRVRVWNAPEAARLRLLATGVRVASVQARSRLGVVARAVAPSYKSPDILIRVAPSLSRYPRAGSTVTIVHDVGFANDPSLRLGRLQRAYRQSALSSSVRHSHLLACVSESARSELERFTTSVSCCTVLHPAVTHMRAPVRSALRRQSASRRRLELVMFGHARNKGVQLAIEALERSSEVGLTLFARREQLAAWGLAGIASKAEAQGQLSLIDNADDDEVARRILGADVFVMPSEYEGFGLPAAEAMLLGVPTVISPLASLREATRGGAVVMESFTSTALLSAAEYARSRPSSDWSVARQAIQRWTWGDYTDALLAQLDSSPAKNGRPT